MEFSWICLLSINDMHTITGTRIEMFSLRRRLVLDTKELASNF